MKRVASAAVLALVVSAALCVAWKEREASVRSVPAHPTDGAQAIPGTQALFEGLEDEPPSSERSTIPVQPENVRKAAALAGVVVDDSGAPLQAAEVLMIPLSPKDGSGGGEREKPRTAQTDATGRFRFEVSDAARMYRLHASSPGYLDSEGGNVQANRSDLRLVLMRARFVSGHIVLDDCVPTDQIRLLLDRPSGEGRPLQWADEAGDNDFLGRLLSPDGGFAFEGVSASPVDLTVFAQGVSIATIEGIDAGLRGATSDPRLDPLDLRGRLTCFTIEVQDDAGGPCSGAVVAIRSSDFAVDLDKEVMAQDSRAKFVVPTGTYDVEIRREGYRRIHLSSVAEDRIVRLRRGIAVRFVVDPRPILPPAPHRLLIALIHGTDERAVDIDCMGELDNAGAATLLVSSPGPHRVAWYLENGNRRHFLYGISTQTVEVLDRDESEEIRLDDRPEIRRSWEAMIRQVESGK